MMQIVFFGKGNRGFKCLFALIENKFDVTLVVGPHNDAMGDDLVLSLAKKNSIPWINPDNPNLWETESRLIKENADIHVLGGYGKILKKNILSIPKLTTLNLHGGKLPEMRGSSPMNWALINGHETFTLTVIETDVGIDTGKIIYEETQKIEERYTIVDLHRIANELFPKMLIEVIRNYKDLKAKAKEQVLDDGAYYPLRSEVDGFVLFDMLTSKQIFNTIRALTTPYPCAFTFYRGRKVKLISAKYNPTPFYGEAGKVYRISKKREILVCAKDNCLWITKAVFEDDGTDLSAILKRYETLSTVRETALNILTLKRNNH
jgi:methionyl-tRNA formyltransferase